MDIEIEKILEIGLPIEIEIPIYDKSKGKEFFDVYFSQIIDFDENSISVSMPQRQGNVPLMYKGDTIYLRLTTDEAIYSITLLSSSLTLKLFSKVVPSLAYF